MVRTYLGIEETRFRDRLSVSFNISPDTVQSLVPNLLLQPIVENAIRHGIAPRASGGHVEISSTRANGMLEIRVKDDGVGIADSEAKSSEGVGLSNTRRRLETLYGTAHDFSIGPVEGGGTEVVVKLPHRSGQDEE